MSLRNTATHSRRGAPTGHARDENSRSCLRACALMIAWWSLTGATACAPPVVNQPSSLAAVKAGAQAAIAAEQTINPASIPESTIVVAPFRALTNDDASNVLAYGLADLLMVDLSRSRRLAVVERTRMDAMLRELQLVSAGRIDSNSAPRVGRLVGARRIVVGALGLRPVNQLAIDARIANVVSGEVRPAVSAAAPLDDIFAAEKALAFRLFDELGINLTPTERAAVEQRPTKNIAALLAYSRGVYYETLGDYRAARRSYQEAARRDPGFGLATQRETTVRQFDAPLPGAVADASTQSGVARVTAIAGESVNPSLFPVAVGPLPSRPLTYGATDPSFTAQIVTIVITVTAR